MKYTLFIFVRFTYITAFFSQLWCPPTTVGDGKKRGSTILAEVVTVEIWLLHKGVADKSAADVHKEGADETERK